ncbi:phage shock protein PspA [Teredinibacter turnerae]|uniref:phage shock protein PspA n=1 Tax=Teredinibacter turnerae TaxID=2426 RepID=UPI00035C1553|nr:phage shock protein PspA [Teredinibacter turnerae]
MGIFSRFSDIINSNINALLDKAEDPEKMVRLIIQEMEETLVEVRTVSAKAIADKKELLRRKQWLVDQSETWEEKAELAIQKGREDLAKGALAEKLRFINDASQVDTELEIIEENLLSLENEITQLQNKIAEAKARQKSLVSRRQTADSKLKVRMVIRGGSVDEKLSKLEGYERKLDELEGKAESYDLGKKSLAEEIEQLAKDEEVEAQLAALREKVKTKTENN